jgi:predicted  nucleic acid-binding Zn-ribbon protein
MANAGNAQRQLQRMRDDLAEVSSRERSLADAAEKLAKELYSSKQATKSAAVDMANMRTQVEALQEALRTKGEQLCDLESTVKQGSEV